MSTFKQARAQFIKALDIIDRTQLTVFLQRELPQRTSLINDVDALESKPLEEAVAGMQQKLNKLLSLYNDPFANYITPKQHESYKQRRTGGFVGIGVKYRAVKDDYPLIIGPLLGGPLESENIQPGDKVLRADNKDLHGLLSRDISEILKGEPGSRVTLSMLRDGEPVELTATRQSVQLHYARAQMLDNEIGYIRISRFGGKTHERVKPLLENLLEQGPKGLILDVRDNPGGSTRAARNIMSLFEEAAWVFCEQYKSGAVKRLPREGETLTRLPLVVLINEHSMSSAEILAGALQSYNRATLVGAPSYGKGLIQRVFPLASPLSGAVRTTIAMYGTPSHQLLHGRGLVPDIYVPTPPERLYRETGSVNISQKARQFRRSLELTELKQQHDDETVAAYANIPDVQLNVAISNLMS